MSSHSLSNLAVILEKLIFSDSITSAIRSCWFLIHDVIRRTCLSTVKNLSDSYTSQMLVDTNTIRHKGSIVFRPSKYNKIHVVVVLYGTKLLLFTSSRSFLTSNNIDEVMPFSPGNRKNRISEFLSIHSSPQRPWHYIIYIAYFRWIDLLIKSGLQFQGTWYKIIKYNITSKKTYFFRRYLGKFYNSCFFFFFK